MSAPEWEQGYGLSWSGRWHLIAREVLGFRAKSTVSACGAYLYTSDEVPKYHRTLLKIATGEKSAPICKKCAKAKAAQ